MRKDSTPKAWLLRALQNQRWTVAGAISELVDNSFGLGRGAASRVSVTWNPRARVLEVLDNGRGMDELVRLFQLGNTVGRTPGDIGHFGSGGTMALLWLAERVKIWTLRDGRVSQDEVSWNEWIARDEYPSISDDWKRATINSTPPELLALKHGTLIRLCLPRARKFYPSNVQRDLAETYAPAVRLGAKLTWQTAGSPDAMALGTDIELPADCQSIDLTLEIGGLHLRATGKIGLIPNLPVQRSQIAIGFGHRIITKTRDCYVSPEGEAYTGSGITGWIDLGDGWQPYLTTTKDAMNDSPAWEALMGAIYQQIAPLLEQAKRQQQDLIFDDIAVSLGRIFEGKLTGDQPAVEPLAGQGTRGPREAGGTGGGGHRAQLEFADDGDRQKPGSTACRLAVTPVTAHELDGDLAVAIRLGDEIRVLVNREHRIIEEALKSEPVNRDLLASHVSYVIANLILEDPTLAPLVFTPRLAGELDALGIEARRRRIVRLVLDRYRRVA